MQSGEGGQEELYPSPSVIRPSTIARHRAAAARCRRSPGATAGATRAERYDLRTGPVAGLVV